jgi:hypothetical protein
VCAGPGPFFWFLDQACFHGISGYVVADSLEFDVIATPVIAAFLLPEWPFGALEDLIAEASGDALQTSCDPLHFDFWSEQPVDVIGHHYEGVQVISAEF